MVRAVHGHSADNPQDQPIIIVVYGNFEIWSSLLVIGFTMLLRVETPGIMLHITFVL